MNLDDLELFVHVAERRSFTLAAAAMGLPKSTVSRRVQRLEADLGMTLIQRSGRAWSLTEDGHVLASRSEAAVRELAQVRQSTLDAADTPGGTLRLSIPLEFSGSFDFAELLHAYHRRYPDVVVEVVVDPRRMDLVAERIDLALRAHPQQMPDRAGIVAKRLTAMDGGLVAAPSYLDARGRPATVEDLANHALIAPSVAAFGPAWPFTELPLANPNKPRPPLPSPCFRANGFHTLLAAAAAGFGIAGCPLVIVEEAVAAGRVERVLPETRVPMGTIYAVWPRSRTLAPRVRTFVDFLVERFAPTLAARPVSS
jgi:DNA-binding transcriptional LysR family regulator